jgi:hypothetical protein
MSTLPSISNRTTAKLRGKTPLLLSVLCGLYCSYALAVAAGVKAAPANLTAAQIVEKHVAARGGLQAWRAVQTMSVTGQMDAGSGDSAERSAKIARAGLGASVKRPNNGTTPAAGTAAEAKQVQLPFVLQMKRPHKSRLEIVFAGKTAVQIYDGTTGWKLRPYLNRNSSEPFTAEEAKAASGKGDLDGPLVDYAAKGTKVELVGVEPVEDHDAYKLKLTMKDGDVQHIWIDAQSFLDVKLEGIPRRMDGRMHNVWIYQRDFRSVQGLMIPFVVQTTVEGYRETHRTLIEKVTLNEKLDDAAFGKPTA